MGGKIPRTIKDRVVRDYIQGMHRDKIAANNGIGEGTVTKIINEASSEKEYHDMPLFRHLALVLNENGLELIHLAFAIRLKKIMEENDIIRDQVEDIVTDIVSYCFKRNISVDTAIQSGHEALTLQDLFGIEVAKIPEHIDKLKNSLDDLKEKTQLELAKCREARAELEKINSNIAEIKNLNPSIEYNLGFRKKLEEEISKKYQDEINDSKRHQRTAEQRFVREQGQRIETQAELETCRHKLSACQEKSIQFIEELKKLKEEDRGDRQRN